MNVKVPSLGVEAGDKPLSIAILAMGGQGGGVLMDWIVDLAESEGLIAQSSSVPGVAQRTGATLYYIEMIKGRPGGSCPVLALMPSPGHVDIVIGAELMEAGRAIQRGLVTPDRTTLIASAHRSLAVKEKMAPGDGIGDSDQVYRAARVASKRFLAFDMADIAERTGSSISAVMFGALAGSAVLPFSRQAYEATIRNAGIGVSASLRAFTAGFQAAVNASGPDLLRPAKPDSALEPLASGNRDFDELLARAKAEFPARAHAMLAAGLRRVVDFQDVQYGGEYLDLVGEFNRYERHDDPALVRAAAKYVAAAMAYDDVIRVADLKTRSSRFARVRREMLASPGQIVETTEFMHPRMDEVVGTLPARLGRWLEGRQHLFGFLDRIVNRGRRVRTTAIGGFVLLYVIGGMRRFRRVTLRHHRELAHRDAWLKSALDAAPANYALAVELLKLRRLVKGYSDTHARGISKFDRAMAAALRLRGRADAADWVRRLREAALADEEGTMLDDALKTIDTFLT